MERRLKTLVLLAAVLASFALAGCQPSITSQLEAGLPQAAPRPSVMPDEVGKDAEVVATGLMDSGVKVRVMVPERTVPASATAGGGKIIGVYVKPVSVDMVQADRQFAGFKIVAQDPASGVSLGASQTVVLTVGEHPKALPGATWYATHPADVKRYGDNTCLNSGGANETGCHVQSYCVDCHSEAIKAPKLGKP